MDDNCLFSIVDVDVNVDVTHIRRFCGRDWVPDDGGGGML